jgi:hypothetical protein
MPLVVGRIGQVVRELTILFAIWARPKLVWLVGLGKSPFLHTKTLPSLQPMLLAVGENAN